MRFYPENSTVPFDIAYVDDEGQGFEPANVTVRVLDGDEFVLLMPEVVVGETSVTGVVPANINVAESGEVTARVIIARLVNADGVVVERKIVYGIEPEQMLQVCVNSFQTIYNAQVGAASLVNLTAFSNDTPARQKAALIEAYNRITSLRLTYMVNISGREVWHDMNAISWAEMTEDTFNTQLPSELRRVLRHAQLVEADEILQGNILARKHASGIQSETIGESSVTLRAGFSGNAGMSNFTMSILAPYLDRTIRIGRA